MRISKKKQQELYDAIHNEIIRIRMLLRLTANQDVALAQIEHRIWSKMKVVLGLVN